MGQVAIIIAVEDYLDKAIQPVQFASNDARGFAAALHDLGLQKDDTTVIISPDATKAVISSRMNRILKSLTKDDNVYFYYAGHGFSINSTNYITCYDTQLSDLKSTSIALRKIFQQFRESKARFSLLFIDSCQSGLPIDHTVRGVYSHLSDNELMKFLAQAEGCICFGACKGDENSFSHGGLKHGIWSFHLIKALSGEAPLALMRDKIITPNSLQNYLSKEVPLTVRKLHSTSQSQTPWMTGAASRDLLIADVGHILEKKKQIRGPVADQLKKAVLSLLDIRNVKSLRGFKKGIHRVPDTANSATQDFVEKISRKEVEEIVGEVHHGIRTHLKYKRRELEISIQAGRASIIAPHFDYHLEVAIDEQDPSKADFHEFIENISEPNVILSDAFSLAFSRGFNSIDMIFQRDANIEEIIDRLEDQNDERLTLEYDETSSRLEVAIKGFPAMIKVEADRLSIAVTKSVEPKELFQIVERGLKEIEGHKPLALLPLVKKGDDK